MARTKKTPASAPLTVAVVGLGAVGALAAWQLSKRDGVHVIGLEQYGPVHSHGSYAGESRVFRTAYHEGGVYVPMLLESRAMWRELEADAGRDGLYLEVGCLSIGPEGHGDLRTVLGTIEEFDLPHRVLDAGELRAEFPQHAVADGDIGVLDEYGGGMRPEVIVRSALDVAAANGADLRFNTPVLGIEEDADGVVVRTPQGVVRADRVVLASGSWSTRLDDRLSRLLRLQALGLTWFMPRDISQFTPDRFPAFLRDRGDVHFFGAPSLDGYSVKACGNPTWPVYRDVAEVPLHHTREELVLLGQRAAELMPGLNPEPVRESVHHCAYTPDRTPVVDLSPSGRAVTITGLSGHGFKFTPVLGRWAAQLAVDGSTDGIDERFALESHLERLAERGAYQGGGH